MLTTISSSLIGVVDMQVAGRLGSLQQAAVGISEQILFVFLVFIMSIGVGTTAIVSRATGEQNREESIEATAQSLALSFGMGIVLSLLSVTVAKYGVRLFGNSPEVVSLASMYLSIYSFFLLPFSVVSLINAAYRAIGDSKTPLLIVATMTVINVAGDYATVLGNWPTPGLGIRGIALSGITASTVGGLLGLVLLSGSPLKQALKQLLPVYMSYIKRILKIGIPSACQRLAWATSVFVLFFIFTQCSHPTESIASWTIGMRVEGMTFMPLMALSLAVSSIVGQNLGAAKVERAVKAGWQVTFIGVCMMIALGTCLFVFAEPLAHFMSNDPQTIDYTVSYLRINAFCEPFLALAMILSGALQGAGDTRTPMWITISCNWIIRLPLAWFLAVAMKLGPTGAWWSMSTSVCIMGLLTAWRFQSKGWIKTHV